MQIVCLDLEGVLVPEIWIHVAERTGIDELRATTRDIPDYNVLMKQRLALLDQHNLKIDDIQQVMRRLGRLEGREDRTALPVSFILDPFLLDNLRVHGTGPFPRQSGVHDLAAHGDPGSPFSLRNARLVTSVNVPSPLLRNRLSRPHLTTYRSRSSSLS